MSAPRLYLLDIEGTVAPLTLTSEVLFPYARVHLRAFLEANAGGAAVREDLALLAAENRVENDPAVPCRLDEVSEMDTGDGARFRMAAYLYLLWLMDRDRKSTALKSLQGKIWKAGFEGGELKGTLFADVPPAFGRWAAQGKVAIYSSGSVEAQRLLFRYSNYGDLAPHISGYFDTRTGAKAALASYAAIADSMEVAPADAIFFSDVVRELDAAREAGLETRLVVREGNPPVEDAHGHSAVESLELI
jgi:2,3-diketo-5-methylthio-1-phosphopentane phosphatase